MNLKEPLNLKRLFPLIILVILNLTALFITGSLSAQTKAPDSVLQQPTLQDCIQYALQHNPDLQNFRIDEAITETTIRSKLADWYPQLGFNYSVQHSFQLPSQSLNGNIIHTGTQNISGLQFGATQNIFSRDALLASRSAKSVREFSKQSTSEQNINIAVLVSKAFYDLILTVQQLKVTGEDIVRTAQSLKDAYYRYQSGIVDKTDYKRATISLNNANAQKKFGDESLKAKYSYLKQLMGYPDAREFELSYDTVRMEKEIFIDTSQAVNYNSRIEVQLLETQKALQQYNLQYYKWSFLPNVYAFGNYNMNYLNNQFSKLYSQTYPNSYMGLALSFPIFQGGKRLQQIKQAQLQITQVDNSITGFKNKINTQYQKALSTYKSNLFNYYTLKENLSLANEVYDVIHLQYRSGVKTYLDVITAEADLRTAQINYYNALYQVLSNKIDVEQALGSITY
jgi:outer membrane protein